MGLHRAGGVSTTRRVMATVFRENPMSGLSLRVMIMRAVLRFKPVVSRLCGQ